MAGRKIIITQEQLDEICGETGSFAYLDKLATAPDMGDVFSTEVSPDGGTEAGYSHPTTTDDIANDKTNPWGGYSRGYQANVMREMSKENWKKEFLPEEDNSRLKNVKFVDNGDTKKSNNYGAAKMNSSRANAAANKIKHGTDAQKVQGMNTLKAMKANGTLGTANSYRRSRNSLSGLSNNKGI